MYTVHKSALFMRQWQTYAQNYKDRAGIQIAERFIAAVEGALLFIGTSPLSCPLYDTSKEEALKFHHFRRWNVSKFPNTLFFRLEETQIFVDLIYAQRMDIAHRFIVDTFDP